MLKPLSQRQLDAIRDDPIYFDGDHPDHDAYVAMVDGEYRRVFGPGLSIGFEVCPPIGVQYCPP